MLWKCTTTSIFALLQEYHFSTQLTGNIVENVHNINDKYLEHSWRFFTTLALNLFISSTGKLIDCGENEISVALWQPLENAEVGPRRNLLYPPLSTQNSPYSVVVFLVGLECCCFFWIQRKFLKLEFNFSFWTISI